MESPPKAPGSNHSSADFQVPHPAVVPAIGQDAIRQYGVAMANAAVIFGAFSIYLLYRRGYYNLYIANKILAGVAAILFGLVLLLGPLASYFTIFDRYLKYRKELGMVGAVLAVFHSVVSYFFLPQYFPPARFFASGRVAFAFGLSATLLLVVLAAISNRSMLRALGGATWWWAQRWGVRAMFVAVALHVGVMKMPSWISWYQRGGGAPSSALQRPWLPGAGLLVGWFVGFVLAVRVADIVHRKLGKLVWYTGCITLPVIYLATFWWGLQFRP